MMVEGRDEVRFERVEGVAVVTLDRPDKLNALTPSMVTRLTEVLDEVHLDKSIRVVVLTGAGVRAFSVGFDLDGLDMPTRTDDVTAATEANFQALMRIWQLRVPVVSAVDGYAVAAGANLALLADIVIASSRATFAEPEIRHYALSPLLLLPWFANNPKRVNYLYFTGDRFDAEDVLRQAADAGARAVSFLAGGFAESGAAGRATQDRLREVSEQHDIRLVGPNCYGVANLVDGFAAYFGSLPSDPTPGTFAVVSQSGGVLNAVIDTAGGRGLGFSHLITTGNEASLRLDHYVEALAAEPAVEVIACYLETVRDPAALDRALLAAQRAGRPVVVLRAGRTEAGRLAVAAHTGALATQSRVLAAACRSRAAVLVEDVDELVNACELLARGRREPSRRSVLMSISGGTCALAADVAEEAGVRLAELDGATSAGLREQLPFATTPANPLDLTGVAATDDAVLPRVLGTLDASPSEHDLVLLLNSPSAADEADQETYRRLAHAFSSHAAGSRRHHAIVTSGSGPVDCVVADTAHRHGVPVLTGMRPAFHAMAAVADRDPDIHVTDDLPAPAWPAATEADLKRALAELGFAVPEGALVTSEDDAAAAAARLGFPVVMKAQSPRLAHKTEYGAVRVGLASDQEVRTAYREITAAVRTHLTEPQDAMLVERMVPQGVDVLVGILVDADLGPFLVCGSGGVLAEVLDDVVVRRAPVTPTAARRMIGQTRVLDALLRGVRGAAADVDALVDVLCRLSDVARSLTGGPGVLDLNPVRVLPAGQGAVVLDAWLSRTEGGR